MFRQIACLALFAAASPAAAQSARFDLVCSGTLTTKSIAGEEVEPYATHYRIDLDRAKWCEEECKVLHDIGSVHATVIILQDRHVDTLSERSMLVNTIDRENGEHSVLATHSTPRDRRLTTILDYKGRCERTGFSGFPEFETLF